VMPETRACASDLTHERYAGAYLMPSFGRYEVVAEVVSAAEL